MQVINAPFSIIQIIENYNNFKSQQLNLIKCLPDEILNLVIEFSTNINCNCVCKKWTNVIAENNTISKLFHIDYTQYLPDEILDLIFEFGANLNCNYVCKRWNKIVEHNFKIDCKTCKTICRKHASKECSLCKLFMYATNFNVMRIMSGMGTLRYST